MKERIYAVARPGLLLLCVLAFPTAARAENPTLREGIEAYENFEYEQALKILQKALDHPDSSKKETARVHLYLGLVRFTLGDRRGAHQDFEKAIKTFYEIKLPPDISPKIVTEFEKVKQTIPAPEKDDPVPLPPGGGIVKPAPRPRKRVWTWVAVGIGGAAIVGGGTCAYLASKAKSDFDKELYADKAADLKDQVDTYSLTTNILFGVGAAALVTGLVLFFTEDSSTDEDSRVGSGPSLTITPAGVEATFRF